MKEKLNFKTPLCTHDYIYDVISMNTFFHAQQQSRTTRCFLHPLPFRLPRNKTTHFYCGTACEKKKNVYVVFYQL